MQFAEIRRWQDFRKPGSQGDQYFLGLETVLKGSGDPSYPGQLALARILACLSAVPGEGGGTPAMSSADIPGTGCLSFPPQAHCAAQPLMGLITQRRVLAM